MNSPHQIIEAEAPPKRVLISNVLRCLGFVLCAVLTILAGLVHFLLGVLVQIITRRRIPCPLVGLLGSALFFAFWLLMDWLMFRIGTGSPFWPSIVLSLILFVAYFVSGARLTWKVWSRRIASA